MTFAAMLDEILEMQVSGWSEVQASAGAWGLGLSWAKWVCPCI